MALEQATVEFQMFRLPGAKQGAREWLPVVVPTYGGGGVPKFGLPLIGIMARLGCFLRASLFLETNYQSPVIVPLVHSLISNQASGIRSESDRLVWRLRAVWPKYSIEICPFSCLGHRRIEVSSSSRPKPNKEPDVIISSTAPTKGTYAL